MTELPQSAAKVAQALHKAGLDVSITQMLASTRTAEDAAKACQCTPSQIVKSLVFQGKTTQSPLLFLVSGSNRVDVKLVAEPVGEPLRRPDADYVRATTGFAIGGIPPIGHETPLRTFIDEDLLKFDKVWAAAGTPKCVFSVDPARLSDACQASVIRVCQPEENL